MKIAGKEVIVLSLGGSLIVPEKIDIKFFERFREVIKKNTKKYKFVIICGGGVVARKYIQALKEDKKNDYLQSLIGISVTRLNARFMSYIFGFDPEYGIPHDMKEIKNRLEKKDIIFCGALRYAPNQTSDATAIKIAAYLKTEFINLTNVKGLYNKNPMEDKTAIFLPRVTFQEFSKIVLAIPNKPGMHAPVDHTALKIMTKNKIKTYILGKDPENLDKLLNNKKFIGTIIN